MSQGPSAALFVAPPEPEPPGELPAMLLDPPVPVLEPPTLPLPPALPLPPVFPLPPAPVPVWSSIVPEVGYSVLCGVNVTLPPAAQYEYGVSAMATASVRVF